MPEASALRICHPDAAGIDVGSRSHYVAVSADRDPQPVREFGCYTPDLEACAAWLHQCGITTVALESTGVYWVQLFLVLQASGLEVIVVNPQQTKSAPGRATDVQSCQWIQQLHTYGLLRASFRPTDTVATLQGYWRQRDQLVKQAADAIRHMQKALDLMNLHLHKAISDLAGVTGLRIVRAIVAGERNPHTLATLKAPGIKCSTPELVRALTGHYRPEQLFALQVALQQYDFYTAQVAACDEALAAYLQTLPTPEPEPTAPPSGPRPRQGKADWHNRPAFDLAGEMDRLLGKAVVGRLPGLGVCHVMTVVSETGLDLAAWATEKRFCAWLGLSPHRKITGGKVYSSRTRKVVNRAATAFRLAAFSLTRSHTALGAYYRRLRSALGAPKALTALAHKLARLYYRLVRYGVAYTDAGMATYEARYQERRLTALRKRAEALGYTLVEQVA